MSIDDLVASGKYESIEAAIRAAKEEIKKIEKHYGSIDDFIAVASDSAIESDVARKRAAKEEIKKVEEHYGSIDDLIAVASRSGIEAVEAGNRASRSEVRHVEQNYGSIDDFIGGASDSSIEAVEAGNRASRSEVRHVEQNYGSTDDFIGGASDSEIESDVARKRANRSEVRHVEQNYGSIDDFIAGASDSEIEIAEAIAAEQRKKEDEYIIDFKELVDNPSIIDLKKVEDGAIGSIESKRVRDEIVKLIHTKIEAKTGELKNPDKSDEIEAIKVEIEKMVAIYERYMYSLKEKQYNFSDLHEMKIPEEVKEELWKQQKRLGITFTMPIPADMGEYYGGKFERDCKMIPGLEWMYQDLTGKEVSWHQVMMYKEGELTPSQRRKQRLIGEIKENQEVLAVKQGELGELERQQGGNVYGE